MMLLWMTADNTGNQANDNERLERLISRVATGEMGALEELYSLTKSAVYGFALSIQKSPHAAEDTMQDTYLRIHQAAGGYTPKGKPMAWILTIARNLALMKLREGARTSGPPPEEAQPGRSDPGFEARSDDMMLLKAALTILSDEERQVLLLHSLSGLKHREIAEIMDIPLSTTLSKYHRALSKLKNHAKEEAL